MEHQSNQLQPYVGSVARTEAANDTDENSFDPWLLWVTVRRCWYWAVPIGLVLAVISAFAVLQSFVPRFRATYSLAANRDFLIVQGVMPQLENLPQSEKSIVFSPIVLSQVLDKPELQAFSLNDPNPDVREQSLRKNLAIGGKNSNLLISYTDTDKQFASDVCNAVVQAYLQKRDEFDNRRIGRLENFLSPQVEDLKRIVEEQEKEVSRLARETRGVAPGERVAALENSEDYSVVKSLRSQMKIGRAHV